MKTRPREATACRTMPTGKQTPGRERSLIPCGKLNRTSPVGRTSGCGLVRREPWRWISWQQSWDASPSQRRRVVGRMARPIGLESRAPSMCAYGIIARSPSSHAGFEYENPTRRAERPLHRRLGARQDVWLCVCAHFKPLLMRSRPCHCVREQTNADISNSCSRSTRALSIGPEFGCPLVDETWRGFREQQCRRPLVGRTGFLAQIARAVRGFGFPGRDRTHQNPRRDRIIHGRTAYKKPDGQAGAGRLHRCLRAPAGTWLCVSADVTRG